MIRYEQDIIDANHFESWQIFNDDFKVGYLWKFMDRKENGKFIAGHYYLNIFYSEHKVSLNSKKIVDMFVKVAVLERENEVIIKPILEAMNNQPSFYDVISDIANTG